MRLTINLKVAKPKTICSASAGPGTSQHLALELLGCQSYTQFIHVPYTDSGPASNDAIGGLAEMMFDTTVVAAPHIQSGKVRALAVTSARRPESLSNIPKVAESGVPDFGVLSWQAVFAPAGTPKPIVERLYTEMVKILKLSEMQDRLKTLGMQPSAMAVPDIAAFQKTDGDKWAQVITAANIKLQ